MHGTVEPKRSTDSLALLERCLVARDGGRGIPRNKPHRHRDRGDDARNRQNGLTYPPKSVPKHLLRIRQARDGRTKMAVLIRTERPGERIALVVENVRGLDALVSVGLTAAAVLVALGHAP